ncbi:MAG: AAA domain-containing protein [Marinifilaceae bacterium]
MNQIIDLKNINDFIVKELRESQSKIEQLWARDVVERVKARKAIERVRFSELFTVADYDDCYFARAFVHENVSDFKEGESVRIHDGNPRNYVARGQIYSIDYSGDIIIGFSSYELRNAQRLDAMSYYIMDKDVMNMQKIYDAALFRMQESPQRSQFLSMLNAEHRPVFTALPVPMREYLDKHGDMLNASQREAVERAVTTQSYHLIQGPPGTGKTHILALIAILLAQVKGERVLITAPTHLAINNALAKCAALGFPLDKISKVGQRYNREGLKGRFGEIKSQERISALEFFINEGKIMGISPFHLHTSRAKNTEFDTVIIDEAGQMNCAVAMMAMGCAKRYILVGDHKQMAPIYATDEHPEALLKSVFELLYRQGGATMLDITYRMNEVVADFSSREFYGGRLKPFSKHINRRLATPSELPMHLRGEEPVVYIPMEHTGCTVCAPPEAECIVKMIDQLINEGHLPANEIAVVAPFKAQGRLIKSILVHTLGKDISKEVVVDTVERMQGQEREVIIVSMVSSKPEFVQEIADFYFQPNRLNVAITRAKNKLIVVGSRAITGLHSEDEKIDAHMRVYDRFFEACKKIERID